MAGEHEEDGVGLVKLDNDVDGFGKKGEDMAALGKLKEKEEDVA